MSYVGEMKDLIELYLAEFKRDGCGHSCGVPLWQAKELLTDFAQWLEDDVQDTETTPEGNDSEWIEYQEWLESGEDRLDMYDIDEKYNPDLNLTGFGDIVEDSLADDEGNTGSLEIIPDDELNEELNATSKDVDVADWAAKRRQYIQRLQADTAWGYLNALNEGEDSNSADS